MLFELPAAIVLAVLVVALALVLAADALLRPAADDALNAPTAPAVDCVPLSAPPEVLTQTSLSVSGLCQKLGSTSITT